MNLGSLSLSVTISDGETTRTVPALAVATVFRMPPRTCCDALKNLLFEASYPQPDPPVDNYSGEGVRGEGERSETLRNKYISKRSETFGGGLGEGVQPEAFAESLAIALDDPGSIGGYLKLVRVYPANLLREALRRTLFIPSSRIHKTRGACFTAIVRKLASNGSAEETDLHR